MVECYAFYCNQLGGLWPAVAECIVVQNDEDTSLLRSSSNQQLEQHKLINWDQVEAFAVNLSRVSLVLVDGDKSGMIFFFCLHLLSINIRTLITLLYQKNIRTLR